MTWSHLSLLGLEFELVATVVIGLTAYRSVGTVWRRALSSNKSNAGPLNERAHELGVIRAETLLGVGLLGVGFVFQALPYFFGGGIGFNSTTEKLVGLALILIPIAVAAIGWKTVVPWLVWQVDEKRALNASEKAEHRRTGKVPRPGKS